MQAHPRKYWNSMIHLIEPVETYIITLRGQNGVHFCVCVDVVSIDDADRLIRLLYGAYHTVSVVKLCSQQSLKLRQSFQS